MAQSGDWQAGATTATVAVVDGSTGKPVRDALVTLCQSDHLIQALTGADGQASFSTGADPSLATVSVSYPDGRAVDVGPLHWKRRGDQAAATLVVRTLAPFPVQILAWTCAPTWVRRLCSQATGELHVYDNRNNQLLAVINLPADEPVALPIQPAEADFVIVADGQVITFPSVPIDSSVDPPALLFVFDGGVQ